MGPHDILPADREDLARAYDDLIAGMTPAGGMNSYYLCKDGSRLPFESTRHVLRSGERWLIAAISRDIRERIAADAERKEAETRIKGLNRVYSVLSGINALIVRARSREDLFRESCRLAVEAGKFSLAWIAVREPGAGHLRLAAWHGAGEGYVESMPMAVDPSAQDYGLGGRAFAERRAIAVADMTVDGRVVLQDEARKRGFRSVVALPLFESGEVAAVLTLYGGEIGFFDEDEMSCCSSSGRHFVRARAHRKGEQARYSPTTTR